MTGPICILAFVVLSAFRDVFFADALRAAPFFAVAFIAFSTCTAAFLLAALVEKRRSLRVVFADLRTFALMNLFTALAWLSISSRCASSSRWSPTCCMPGSVR